MWNSEYIRYIFLRNTHLKFQLLKEFEDKLFWTQPGLINPDRLFSKRLGYRLHHPTHLFMPSYVDAFNPNAYPKTYYDRRQ